MKARIINQFYGTSYGADDLHDWPEADIDEAVEAARVLGVTSGKEFDDGERD